jgi:hypothetical protein
VTAPCELVRSSFRWRDRVLLTCDAPLIAEQTKMFTAYVRTKAGKITLCAMPRKWRDVEETAADMSKVPDVERVSVAAYGRIIASFKGGVRIDLEAP